MAGDYTKFTFKPQKDYSGVLKQQGRVDLDADWNELIEIIDRRWRAETMDIIGRAVAPMATTPDAFLITPTGLGTFNIGIGRMYVDGLQPECHGITPQTYDAALGELLGTVNVPYDNQPYFPNPLPPILTTSLGKIDLVFLDVWQREVTAVEDPKIQEIALGGPDTDTRVQTAWQVRVLERVDRAACSDRIPAWDALTAPSAGRLTTAAVAPPASEDECVISPTGGYKGLENRLYRVEIHTPGTVGGAIAAQFKWSRDNASITSAVEAISPGRDQITVKRIGRDPVLRFHVGDWIEVLDDHSEFKQEAGRMVNVTQIDEANRILTVVPPLASGEFDATDPARHTRVRRWDQKLGVNPAGLLDVTAGPIPVEDGIQITFGLDPATGNFRVGDYWVFAARTADGSVELLSSAPPRGVLHHYCRLGFINWGTSLETTTFTDCRNHWPPVGCCECTVIVNASDITATNTLQGVFDRFQNRGVPIVVCLMPGTYNLGSTLRLTKAHSNFTLRACQSGSAVLTAQPGLESGFVTGLIALNNASNFTLDGLVLRLPIASNPTTSIGILVQDCNDLVVENCKFNFSKPDNSVVNAAGILATGGCTGMTIQDTRFVGSRPSRSVSLGFVMMGRFGVEAPPALDGALFCRNTFEGLTIGLLTAATAGAVKAQDNRIKDCFGGIWFNSFHKNANEALAQWLTQAAADGAVFNNIETALEALGQRIPERPATSATPLFARFHLANNQIVVGSSNVDSGFALLITVTPEVELNSSVVLNANELRAHWLSNAALITGVAFVSITGNLILNLKTPPDETGKIPLSLAVFPTNVAMAVAGNVLNCRSNLGPGFPPGPDIQPIPFDRRQTPYFEQLNTWKFSNSEPLPPP